MIRVLFSYREFGSLVFGSSFSLYRSSRWTYRWCDLRRGPCTLMMAFNSLEFFTFSVDPSKFGMFSSLALVGFDLCGSLFPHGPWWSNLGYIAFRSGSQIGSGAGWNRTPNSNIDCKYVFSVRNYENRFNWTVHCLQFGQPSNHASLKPHYLNLTLCFVLLQISLLPFWKLWDGNVGKVFFN